MKTSKRTQSLRKLLELCDDLQQIRRKMRDPAVRGDARVRLRRQSKRKHELLVRDLSAYRFRGPVGQLMRECKLSTEHFQVLAVLLHRHLRSEEPACEGRLVLANIFESSFEVLSGTGLLHETSPLRACGLVVLEDDEELAEDILEARFLLSTEALQAFREEVTGGVPDDLQRRSRPHGYASNREFLVDLRILHNLYRLRSERVFHQDRWDRVHNANRHPGESVSRRIDAFWGRIRDQLDRTEGASEFPVVRFLREHDLTDEETIIVIHLLFKELYEGNAYADTAELLKLVSTEESDLIRNRRLVMPHATLVTAEILALEPMIEKRELTAEAHLSDWAVNYIFGTTSAERDIHPDERLDWHLYLKGLGDTGTFYRDLEAN